MCYCYYYHYASQDLIFVCVIVVDVLKRIVGIYGDCNCSINVKDQRALRRFTETTNPRKKARRKTSESWLVKLPTS